MRSDHFRWLFLASACAFVLNPLHSTQAQWGSFAKIDNQLKSDDMDAVKAATTRLLNRPQPVEGSFETWSNPRSGASGKIVAGKPLTRNGMDCQVLNYFTHVPGPNARTRIGAKHSRGARQRTAGR